MDRRKKNKKARAKQKAKSQALRQGNLFDDTDDEYEYDDDLTLEDYEAEIEAFEKSHGEIYFRKNEGFFWGLDETRPYMSALEGMAGELWLQGEHYKSAAIMARMLHLNPNDNQGIRYALVSTYIFLNQYKEAHELLEKYKDDPSAAFAYSRFLLDILENKITDVKAESYIEAIKANPYIPSYILGEKDAYEEPHYYGMGDENEAIVYANMQYGQAAWNVHPDAMRFLELLSRDPGKKPKTPDRKSEKKQSAKKNAAKKNVRAVG